MSHRLVPSLLMAALALLLAGPLTARAQDTTELPVTPDPSECTVQAPTPAEFVAMANASPQAGTDDAMAAATPSTFTLPEGAPADEETRQAVIQTLREVVACINAGDYLAFYAYASPRLLHEQLAGEGITEENIAAVGTPVVVAEGQRATLVDVREVIVLPDGRVGALVDTIFPEEQPGVQTDFFAFVEQDGRWLIDEIVEDLEGQYPPEATPTA
ncbi:MAG: hypothetical protein QOF33_2137 [Thermomicrobiales bacterium]|nr:hypothetical protein [Thermomicrobiales bacterium]MEA2526640.1 hypothetical protein [Thermomicrobiales bacterium]MEA2584052.1 hypothetical protein [Thermomicrobiales bacterium]